MGNVLLTLGFNYIMWHNLYPFINPFSDSYTICTWYYLILSATKKVDVQIRKNRFIGSASRISQLSVEVSADVKYQHCTCNRLRHRLHMLLCPCWVSGGLSGEAQTRISGSSGPAEPSQWRLEFISGGLVLLCLAPQPNGLRELVHSPAPHHHQAHYHMEADRSQPMRREREESGDEVTVRLG